MEIEAPAVAAGGITHTVWLARTCTDAFANVPRRHVARSKSSKPSPRTATTVLPTAGPERGLSVRSAGRVWYLYTANVCANCWPLSASATSITPLRLAAGATHVTSSRATS